ncbi:glycoside hydrolase family 2 protein, partial [Chitinophaga sp.]|uniref:glycoside hydrolase family 2 protein n=1 Tax=Chitinophaga sp. TaxID=1869181 RepID=UPI002F94CCC4
MSKKIIWLSCLLLTSGIQSSWGQTTSFNDNWQFKGVEFMDKSRVDSFRKLGVNWSDQFRIEKENQGGTTLSVKDTSLSAVLETVENLKWEMVRLPHTAFPEPLVIVAPREGIAFYRKRFFLDKKLADKDISIEFEGVMQVSDIWVNGKYVGRNEGGYLPFVVTLSDRAIYGQENEIVLRVNNQANPVVPPGKPVQKLDFVYYSGIYRNVLLHVKNRLHITNPVNADKQAGGGIFVTYPLVTKQEAVMEIQTDVQNNDQQRKTFVIRQEIFDQHGKRVASATGDPLQLEPDGEHAYVQSLKVNQPSLWHPDHPSLYTLKSSILSDGVLMDSQTTQIGIRSFEITKEKGLLINGEPYRLVGTNRHQNYPYIGNALSDEASYRDVWLIKSAGLNAVRTAHYPQGAAFLNAADKLGILIIDCIPGWQFFNKHPSFEMNVMKDIRQMIRTDRNHPSVLLWETSLNETYPDSAFRCRQAAVARQEWRGTANFFTSGDSYFTKACWDVPYDDWNGDPGARNNTTYTDRPFLIREYGD